MLICPNCSTRCFETETTICPTCQSDLSTVEEMPPERAKIPTPEAAEKGRRVEAGPFPARFEPGTLLGERYRVIKALGRGGMGEVYLADDLELGGSVALKFLPEEVERDERKLEMLLYETRIARTVSHPNVCRVHDIGVHPIDSHGDRGGKLHFISMEYIDGEDLALLQRRIGRLPKAKALELSLEICAGLQAVHDRGLLHCDIKPQNVMIDGYGHARIADFGLAVVGSESATYGGTPAYMAPEQHTGRETTVRSDVYALGLVLYELFTGQRAFRAKTPTEYAWLHLQTRPMAPSVLVPGLDPEIEKTILGCLETLPERRIPTAVTVANRLSEINPSGPTLVGQQVEQGETLCTLLLCDLVDSTTLAEALGNRRTAELGARHDRLARDLLARHEGREIDKTDGFLLLFERPIQALRFALGYHEALGRLSKEEGHEITARVGIHFSEIWLRENPAADVARGAKPVEVEGLAKAVAARLMSVAEGGQTLLSRGAFDLARRATEGLEEAEGLRWLDHGSWRLRGVADPVDVFEVGREGRAPLRPPEESEKVRRLLMQPRIEGWRPAPGLTIPGRPNWQVERRLGEGGFGEVWLARHSKTSERRSFKFCFDTERLRALQREITLFRLLKEELGDRNDINRILDWNLENAPYFIESEYSSAGNLAEWAETEGGLAAIALTDRLEILAQVATALAAAHSVGILHKDVKPSNILIRSQAEGGVQAQLADFGIGQVTERERLASAGITMLGLSERTLEGTSSSGTGTRLYMAPELLEGHAPTLQSDLYALGVMLYQAVVGDLGRAIAPGWRRDIDDELLANDIACFMDRSPDQRPDSAREMAERLRTLEERRRQHEATIAAREALEDAQRRRKIYRAVTMTSLLALVVVSALAIWAVDASRKERQASEKERQAREAADQVLDFVVGLFEITDPYGTDDPGESRGETVTAREILDRGANRIENEFDDRPLVRARLMATFGNIYRSLGLYDTAQPLLEDSLAVRREALGNHPDVAASLDQKGRLLLSKGAYAESVLAHREALDLRKYLLGEEHIKTLESMHGLAESLGRVGDLEQAKKVMEQAVDSRKRVLGHEHPDTLESTGELASILGSIGDHEQSRLLREQALEIQKRLLGPEHPSTLGNMSRLARTLSSLGELEEADRLHERTLEIQERVLGVEHPATIATMSSFASSLSYRDFAQSRLLYLRILELQERVLRPEHPWTLLTMVSLARVSARLGAFDEAVGLLERTLEIQERTLGSENLETLETRRFLAITFLLVGDFARAVRLDERNLAVCERMLGREDPTTLGTKASLAYNLSFIGEFSRAKLLLEQTLEDMERILGPESYHTSRTRVLLGAILDSLGESERAVEILGRTLELQTRLFGSEESNTVMSMHYLAKALRNLGRLEEAAAIQQKSLEIEERVFGNDPTVVLSRNHMALIYWLRGDLIRARELQERALGIQSQVSTLDHPFSLDLTNNLAGTLWKMGEVEEAKELARTTFDKLEARLGAEHYYTTRAARRLLEIAVDQRDAAAISRWTEELRWLTEREESSIEEITQQETRSYVLGIMAALDSGDFSARVN